MTKAGLAQRYVTNALKLIGVAAVLFLVLVGGSLGVIAWVYNSDAKQLAGFYEKRTSVEMELRTLEICLDMQEKPERWQGTSLKPPCDYDKEALRHYMIPKYSDALNSWDLTISQREALLKKRRSGRFQFLAKKLGNP